MSDYEFQSRAQFVIDSEGRRRIEVRVPGVLLHVIPEHARTFAASLLAAVEAEGEPVAAISASAGCNDVASLVVCSCCDGEEDIVIGPRQASMTVPCPVCMPCAFNGDDELFREAMAGARERGLLKS